MIHAQALIGTVLGTVTLQKVVGQGELGVVFLAQQSPSHPQVAVKVLSPAATRVPGQMTDFLERFCQEINIIPSLEHQNILPVLEHGTHNDMAYLVMPYSGDGTLLRAIEQGQLPLSTVADYLDQLSNALDYAHKQGILHLDLKPNNVFVTAKGRLLLTDFGLMKIVAERQTSQMRLLRAGTPVGSLEFMAPEQVMGDVVDARTDLYALGVILYQMVTGKTPFREGTSLQIATQLLQTPPPSPRFVRNDLPLAAEKVMLQALAKRPLDRQATAQDLARAFRAALTVADLHNDERPAGTITTTVNAAAPLSVPRKRGLFDPVWQQPSLAATSFELLPAASEASFQAGVQRPFAVSEQQRSESAVPVSRAPETPLPATRFGLKSRGLVPMDGTRSMEMSPDEKTTTGAGTSATTGELARSSFAPWQSASVAPQQFSPAGLPGFAPNLTKPLPVSNGQQPTTGALPITQPVSPLPATSTSGSLLVPCDESGANKTMKLTEAVKVVQMPVAGQPGRYVTGFLPMVPRPEQPEESTSKAKNELPLPDYVKLLKRFVVPLLVLLVVASSGIFFYLHTRPPVTKTKSGVGTERLKPDWQAISALQATATANANYTLSDSLQQNIHNWPIVASGNKTYLFKNGAYHVTDNDGRQSAATLLPDVILSRPLVYSLTMEEIQGNDSSINNSFGMIFFLNSQVKDGKTVVTFYSFEAANTKGGSYQFLKYDSSKGQTPYTTIWQHGFGGEFHQGQGVRNSNTFKVTISGTSFTFWVNGKQVGTAKDNSISRGQVGMLVNLKGTEVAFSNLQLTYN